MICPYNREEEKQVLQCESTYTEDGQCDCTQQIATTKIIMMQCPKEGCGAWRDGHCCYAAVSLDG